MKTHDPVLTDIVPSSPPSARFLILGSGRLALHLSFYFQNLGLSFLQWNRHQTLALLQSHLNEATHVLCAISDQAIGEVYEQHLAGLDKVCVHFSGALSIDGMIAAHPLMSFGHLLFPVEFYPRIHFVLTGADSLAQALPGLPNSFSLLAKENKAFYHALCVMGGNFTTLLMQKMLQEFSQMQLPTEAARLYMEQILENVFSHPATALTGPLARRDRITLEKNLKTLENDPYQKIYKAFVQAQWPTYFSEANHDHP